MHGGRAVNEAERAAVHVGDRITWRTPLDWSGTVIRPRQAAVDVISDFTGHEVSVHWDRVIAHTPQDATWPPRHSHREAL